MSCLPVLMDMLRIQEVFHIHFVDVIFLYLGNLCREEVLVQMFANATYDTHQRFNENHLLIYRQPALNLLNHGKQMKLAGKTIGPKDDCQY